MRPPPNMNHRDRFLELQALLASHDTLWRPPAFQAGLPPWCGERPALTAELRGEIAEMVSLDISIAAPGQNTSEHAATICMQDMSGPFDYHLTHKLIALAKEHGIAHRRDIFRYYRSDSAAAVEAGNDIRTALIGFGADASHAQERTHRDALEALTQLVIAYLTSEPVARRDCRSMGSIEGFTEQLCPGDMVVPATPLPAPESFLGER